MTTDAPAPLPDRLADAEGELPADIAKAIEAFDKVVSGRTKLHQRAGGPTRDYDIADAAYDAARAALTATILARLTAAESAREAAVARAERLREAAEEAIEYVEYSHIRQRLRAALAHPVTAEET